MPTRTLRASKLVNPCRQNHGKVKDAQAKAAHTKQGKLKQTASHNKLDGSLFLRPRRGVRRIQGEFDYEMPDMASCNYMYFKEDLLFEVAKAGTELDHTKIDYVALWKEAQARTPLQMALDAVEQKYAMPHPGVTNEATTENPQMGYVIPVGFRLGR